MLTEADLRAAKISRADREYHVPKNTFVTPSAKEYLRDNGVELVVDEERAGDILPASERGSGALPASAVPAAAGAVGGRYAPMSRTPIQKRGDHTFVNAVTGEGYSEKPEEMTHLRGNLLVHKTNPRIALRGEIDGLLARVLLMKFRYSDNQALCRDLESILLYLQAILGAEVKDEKLTDTPLLGMNHTEIRRMSHNVKEAFGIDHPIPDSSMGEPALELNLLRTQVREAELAAAHAFQNGDYLGLIEHLNRLSSGVYILFCRVVSGFYGRMEGESHE